MTQKTATMPQNHTAGHQYSSCLLYGTTHVGCLTVIHLAIDTNLPAYAKSVPLGKKPLIYYFNSFSNTVI